MPDPKSFYDFDFIIDLSEKRLEQYTSAYQTVLQRLTNIIIIYSAITIYLVPIIQDVFGAGMINWIFVISLIIFSLLFIASLYFTIRLLIPEKVAYLDVTKNYYQDLRLQYEQNMIKENMTQEEKKAIEEKINLLLKASYIDELARSQENNRRVFSRKSSFYYNALLFGLLATVPYIVCLGFHISKKDDKIQKIEIVNLKKT